MKNFYNLFLLNIKDMWQNHKFLFLIINLFMFFSISFMLISYDICSYEASNSGDTTYISNTFIYQINSMENIETKLDKYIKETKNIRCIFFSFRNNADETISKNFLERKEGLLKYGDEIYVHYYGNFLTFNQYSDGRWFTDSEMENGDKVILAPNFLYITKAYLVSSDIVKNHKINEKYVINNEEYTIIGQNNFIEHAFVIPYESLQDKSMITNIHISIMERYDEAGNKKFDKNVKKYFDVETNVFADSRNAKIERIIILVYLVMFNISILNIVYIYSYLLTQRKTMIGLFKIYGMGKDKSYKYLITEYLVWLLVNYILSVIFSIVFIAIFKYILHQPFRFLLFKEYLLFLLIYLAIYYICFTPIINLHIERSGQFDVLVEGGN